MEFPFDVNAILSDGITVIDRNLKPRSSNPQTFRDRKAELCIVIDEMGKASAKAQALHGPITSACRMQQARHNLYLYKVTSEETGRGSVVGLLKVGCKKLFVYDSHGVQHEVEPLCVLDFYVHESCQRRGYGKMLFEEMLWNEGVSVRHVAIDRPSAKFLSFLAKHYGLKNYISQVNNFVIFDGFFTDRPSRNTPSSSSRKSSAVSRTCLPSPRVSNVTSSCSQHLLSHSPSPVPNPGPTTSRGGLNLVPADMVDRKDMAAGPVSPRQRPPSGRTQNLTLAMGAQQAMYSRHGSPSQDAHQGTSPPLIRRDGPSQDYLHLVNQNNNAYMDRRGGHLRLPPSSSQTSNVAVLPPGVTPANSAWNVFGVPPRAWHNSTTNAAQVANRKYQKTSLW